MLNQKQIIRANHCRQGCVIPVGWVVESVLLILLVCAVRDLSVNVARIARTMELLEKPTTAYREGAEHDNKEE
jgi:hypothetical protein